MILSDRNYLGIYEDSKKDKFTYPIINTYNSIYRVKNNEELILLLKTRHENADQDYITTIYVYPFDNNDNVKYKFFKQLMYLLIYSFYIN